MAEYCRLSRLSLIPYVLALALILTVLPDVLSSFHYLNYSLTFSRIQHRAACRRHSCRYPPRHQVLCPTSSISDRMPFNFRYRFVTYHTFLPPRLSELFLEPDPDITS